MQTKNTPLNLDPAAGFPQLMKNDLNTISLTAKIDIVSFDELTENSPVYLRPLFGKVTKVILKRKAAGDYSDPKYKGQRPDFYSIEVQFDEHKKAN